MKGCCWALGVVVVCAVPSVAMAGGYDTPNLYSARQIGMGGTAVGYVSDPSAVFHNPAGLGHIANFEVLGDFSLLLANVRATPALGAEDVDSDLTIAPLFLVGAGYRVTDWLTLGAGLFPIASAGATYNYPVDTGRGVVEVENGTRLSFVEATLAAAVNLPGRVRLGAAYRVTYLQVDRFYGRESTDTPFLDFKLTGFDWVGFKVGAQWTPLDWLQVGVNYRHKVTIDGDNDEGVAVGQTFTDISSTFVLPSKLGFGARGDWGAFGVATDVEWIWNSQNSSFPLSGVPPATAMSAPGERASVPNVFDWEDQVVVRAGVEYRLLPADDGTDRLALRAGYIYDGETTNPAYPSAFGTPPGPTNVVTAGAGWTTGPWQLNVAYAYRFGDGDVTAADVASGAGSAERPCTFCSTAGNKPYALSAHGLYFDLSWRTD